MEEEEFHNAPNLKKVYYKATQCTRKGSRKMSICRDRRGQSETTEAVMRLVIESNSY
jgi:hypothetical protein